MGDLVENDAEVSSGSGSGTEFEDVVALGYGVCVAESRKELVRALRKRTGEPIACVRGRRTGRLCWVALHDDEGGLYEWRANNFYNTAQEAPPRGKKVALERINGAHIPTRIVLARPELARALKDRFDEDVSAARRILRWYHERVQAKRGYDDSSRSENSSSSSSSGRKRCRSGSGSASVPAKRPRRVIVVSDEE